MDDESWNDYRKDAILWAARRDQAIKNSQQAYKQGDKSKAKSDSDYGKLCGKKCDEANIRAANAIFIQMNESRPYTEIDLHGLFVKEAIERLEDRVIYALNHRMQRLHVIVGQGHHSDGGAKLKPSVMEFARENDLSYAIDERNPGCIVFYFGPFAASPKTSNVQDKRFAPNDYTTRRIDNGFGQHIPATQRFTQQSTETDFPWGWIIIMTLFLVLLKFLNLI